MFGRMVVWRWFTGVECCRQASISETRAAGHVKSGAHARRLRTAYTNTQVCVDLQPSILHPNRSTDETKSACDLNTP